MSFKILCVPVERSTSFWFENADAALEGCYHYDFISVAQILVSLTLVLR